MATVKGTWRFNEVLSAPSVDLEQEILFKVSSVCLLDSVHYQACASKIRYENGCLEYYYETVEPEPTLFFPEWGWVYVSNWNEYFNSGIQTITIIEEQEVSDEFYEWFTANAVEQIIKIHINKNGTTTLATAGKYCDRNIDVNVNVPSNEAEVAKQKAITNSIIDKTIAGDYVNNEVSLVGDYAFAYSDIESVVFLNAARVNIGAFNTCTSLKRAEFANLSSSAGIYGNAFKTCTALEKVVLRGQTVGRLASSNAFADSAIAAGTGFIYVPDNLVDSYKTASNWSAYASQIKPISELEE